MCHNRSQVCGSRTVRFQLPAFGAPQRAAIKGDSAVGHIVLIVQYATEKEVDLRCMPQKHELI